MLIQAVEVVVVGRNPVRLAEAEQLLTGWTTARAASDATAARRRSGSFCPSRGSTRGWLICGAIGSGKTSACMRPFARQLLSWQAHDRRRRMAGLVLEVKGDFCHQVRAILEDAGRGDDYIEIGLSGRWQWNPLSDDRLGSYSLAYTIASLINQLFGKGKEPFWQQAYVNLVRWILEAAPDGPGPLGDAPRRPIAARSTQTGSRG